MNYDRCGHAIVKHLSSVFVFAGYDRGLIATAEQYNLSEDSWKEIAPLPVASRLLTGSVIDGLIYINGYDTSGMYAYNPRNDTYKFYDLHTPTVRSSFLIPQKDHILIGYDTTGKAMVVSKKGKILGTREHPDISYCI